MFSALSIEESPKQETVLIHYLPCRRRRTSRDGAAQSKAGFEAPPLDHLEPALFAETSKMR